MLSPHHQDEAQESVRQRAKIKLERDLCPKTLSALADPGTIEIILNADGKPWQERPGEKMPPIGVLSATRSKSIINVIAGHLGGNVLCCGENDGVQFVTYRAQRSITKILFERCTQLVI